MFIPYEYISKKLSLFLPKRFRQKVLDLGYKLKIKRNLRYIKHNQKIVRKKLKNKKILNVAFYVYDSTKWKCQSVYDLMEQDERFNPCIFVTKNAAPENNFNYQTAKDVLKVYNFFKQKNMKVVCAYDVDNDKFIPFENITPKADIIIYQHPWYVETSQGPVVCSKFALTYYVPYYISDLEDSMEYDLRFHKYIYKYYVPDEKIRKYYAKNMYDKGEKLIVAGHPQLDYYLKNPNNYDKKYVIYAPHWTVCGNNIRYSTFDWNGYEILKFAETHKELNWIFKPHPCLYRFLFTSGYLTKEQTDEYYKRWQNVGLLYDKGDYMDIFQQSYAMITDCGSFLIEYFFTKQPCIHLVSDAFTGNENAKKICSTYYNVHNIEDLNKLFEEVLIKKQDTKKIERLNLLKEFDYPYSAEIILNDLAKNL
ncbi:MAG: CDP-glycerol glycerophosphotransferase family protein [Candidatus Gastranaerophilaceae bacterium]